jgi:hypothetical protein
MTERDTGLLGILRINVAWPDPASEEGSGSSIGIAIASVQWATEIRIALSDPNAFSARASAAGEEPA